MKILKKIADFIDPQRPTREAKLALEYSILKSDNTELKKALKETEASRDLLQEQINGVYKNHTLVLEDGPLKQYYNSRLCVECLSTFQTTRALKLHITRQHGHAVTLCED